MKGNLTLLRGAKLPLHRVERVASDSSEREG